MNYEMMPSGMTRGIAVETVTGHWSHQRQLVEVSRQSKIPHLYARQAANVSRNQGDCTTLVEATKSLLSEASKELDSVGTPTLPNAVIARKTGAHDVDAVEEEEEDQRIRIKENNTQLWTGLDLSGQLMVTLNDRLFRYTFLRRLYLNGNRLKSVPKCIADLKSLRVLDLSNNLLTEVPEEMGFLFNLRYLYLFDNDLKQIPDKFGNLVSLEFLGIDGNIEMDKEVVQLICKKGTRGLMIHLRDEKIKLPVPKPRNWLPMGDDGEMNGKEITPVTEVRLNAKDSSSFTLMSYNTLCQHYATPKMYKYTPSWALNWEHRLNKLTEEIANLSANVICLQEVESRTYEEYWVPLMLSKGYEGIFHCKSRAKTMNEKGAKRVDGCATFFQKDVFDLVDKWIVEYGKLVMSQERFQKTEDVFNRFMNKDNIASVSVLQHKPSGRKVVVANTHLHWDPEYNDVKAMQVAVLLEELQLIIKKIGDPQNVALVVCGDFNSQRDSAVYELLSNGKSVDHGDLTGRDYGPYTSQGLKHALQLKSAYNNELPFTNFTPTFTEVIDYVWYSSTSLSVRGLLGPVDEEYSKQVLGFPTAEFPSDHVSLVTRFSFKERLGKRRESRKT